jgi:hypothetical protein
VKQFIGWTVLRKDRPVAMREGSVYGRSSRHVTPVYNTLAKARRKATVLGLTYDAIVEAFVEVSDT